MMDLALNILILVYSRIHLEHGNLDFYLPVSIYQCLKVNNEAFRFIVEIFLLFSKRSRCSVITLILILGYFFLIDSTNDVSKRTSPIPGKAFSMVRRNLRRFIKGKKSFIFWLILNLTFSFREIA